MVGAARNLGITPTDTYPPASEDTYKKAQFFMELLNWKAM